MYSLEDWIKQLLTFPIDEVNRKYVPSENDIARKEVESLLEIESRKFGSNDVSAESVQKLHLKIREQECETAIWDANLFYLRGSLPTEIAHDLINRDIVVSQLGHTRQNDKSSGVWRRWLARPF